ncbi:MAG: pilus assembly protein TadG-related protein, partial [Phycisphaerales bacterium]
MKTTTKRPGWADRDMNVVRCRNVLFSPDSCLHPRCGALRAKYLRRRGIGYVWTAVFLLLIILLLGLSLDAAKVYLVAHQLHNAADAGALAGACIVKMDQDLARQQAIDTAYENLADHESVFLAPNPENDPNGDVVLGRWLPQSRTFEPTTANPNAVKVVTRRTTAHLTDGEGGPVSLNFGYI